MRVAGRAARRPFADLPEGVFQRVDKVERNRRFRPRQIVLDRLIDIAPRLLAKDDRLAAHRRPASRTRSREPVKVVRIGRGRLRRCRPFEKQAAQALPILILANQFADG